MRIILAEINNKPVILELQGDRVLVDGVEEPIKNLTQAELEGFQTEIANLPEEDPEARTALANAIRAAFLAKLLGKAVGDDCIDRISSLLDQVHFEVLRYLGDAEL